MTDKFYHYTDIEQIRSIFAVEGEGHCSRSGLVPRTRFINFGIQGLPDRAHEGAVFGLLNPLPKGWVTEQWGDHGGDDGMPVLETVFHYKTGREFALLEVTVDPEKDDIFVADYGVHLPSDYKGSSYRKHPGTLRAKWNYYNSLIPWSEYQASPIISHILPEVVCFSGIPPERIRPVARLSRFDFINDIRNAGGYHPYPAKPKTPAFDVAGMFGKRLKL